MPTSVKRKNENIIDFDERRRYKSLEEQSDSNTERWYLVEIYNKLQEIANSNYKVLSKKLSEEHIIELEKENALGVYIIDPYYLICGLLISLTLFLTAIVAIKDWKDFLNEK